MTHFLILTGLILFALPTLFRGLRHPSYAVHALCVGGLAWLVAGRMPDGLGWTTLAGKAALLHLVWVNISVFCLYFWDKKQSERKGWRIPERTLHAFALSGGSIGALLAQQTLRHKNRKQSFKNTFYLILMAQILLIAIATGFSLQR